MGDSRGGEVEDVTQPGSSPFFSSWEKKRKRADVFNLFCPLCSALLCFQLSRGGFPGEGETVTLGLALGGPAS